MQSMDHTNSGITELTDAQLDGIVGGNWLGDLVSAIGNAIVGTVQAIGSAIWHGLTGPSTTPWRGPL